MLFSFSQSRNHFWAVMAFLCFSSFVFPTSASIFSQELKFDRFSMQDGLSQSFVYSFEEDNQGFIWIATQDGLNRFDGENFTHYKNDINNPNSVADNFIRKIFVDKENTLWVGTSKGLSRYNREYDNFDNFYHVEGNHDTLSDDEIWDIYQDNEGTLWISTQSNLHKYIANENRFQKVRIRGFERDILDVKTIYQDLKGNYWFGTFDNGIYVSNSALSFTYALKDKSNNKIFLDVDSLFDIVYFKEQYWLATEKGLYTLDENQKQIGRASCRERVYAPV